MQSDRKKSPQSISIGIGVVVLSTALILGKVTATSDLNYRVILVGGVCVVAMIVLLKGIKGIEIGFLAANWTMALGYRTITISYNVTLHPAEVMLWGLLIFLLVERIVVHNNIGPFWIPPWMLVMLVFCLWGWVLTPTRNIQWDAQLAECKVFLLLVPFFLIASVALRSMTRWNQVIVSVFLAGVWVAGMGSLEFLVPSARTLFSGFSAETVPLITDEGFIRAPFSFWGSPDAVYVCMVAIPLIPALWSMNNRKIVRVLILIAAAILLTGVYISGHRSAWLLILLLGALWVILRKGIVWGMVAIIVGFLSLGALTYLLPDEVAQRFQSGILVFEGKSTDTSGKKRWARAEMSVRNITKSPIGQGWATAGWVHSDFLMVTENLGVPAGLLFFSAFGALLYRLFKIARARSPSRHAREISLSLFLSVFVAGWLLAFDCTVVLPQLAMPVWSVWVLGETWLHQSQMKSTEVV